MAAAVVNASPLIFLAKLGRLDALGIYRPLLTTRETLAEVEVGLERGFREVLAVQRLAETGGLTVRAAPRMNLPPPILGAGERSVLSLAAGLASATAVLDDLAAIRAARHLGIRVRSTPFVLLDNLTARRIDFEQFRALLDGLLALDYRIAPHLFLRLMRDAKRAAER